MDDQRQYQQRLQTFVSDPNRDRLFQKLLDCDLTRIAHETFDRVTTLLPSPVEEIVCHIVPAVGSKGGGACYAPGKILICVPSDELSPVRLKRNIAHEYSHTYRYAIKSMETQFGFGDAVPYRVRDYLIFEGLAGVLAETLFPHPGLPAPEVSADKEADFWRTTDLEAVGMDAYIQIYDPERV